MKTRDKVRALLRHRHDHICLGGPRPGTRLLRLRTRYLLLSVLLIHDRTRSRCLLRCVILGMELRLHVVLKQGDRGGEGRC